MADFYNTSTIDYESATTDYNGAPVIYSYTGSIPLFLVPSYSSSTQFLFVYTGHIGLQLDMGAVYRRGFVRRPSANLTMRLTPNSRIVIRKYSKVKDPIRVGGCPQCGVYTYNT